MKALGNLYLATGATRSPRAARGPAFVSVLTLLLGTALSGCTTVPTSGLVTLTVTHAALEFEDPLLAQHSSPDRYFLHVDFALSNEGSAPHPFVGGSIVWTTGNATPFQYNAVAPGSGSTNGTVYVDAAAKQTPRLFTLTDDRGLRYTAPIPDLPKPADEVVISNVGARRFDAQRDGDQVSGREYLWVELQLENRAGRPVVTPNASFSLSEGGGKAVEALEGEGPEYLEPGTSGTFNLTFSLHDATAALSVHYGREFSPWTSANLSAPASTEPFYDARLTVDSAQWQFEDVGGHLADFGWYFLTLGFTVDNRGLSNFSSGLVRLEWADGNASLEYAPLTWNASEARLERLSFPMREKIVPQTLDLESADRVTHLRAGVPSPSPPPVLIEITNLTTYWSDTDNCGRIFYGGDRSLHVAFTVRNHWRGNLSARSFYAVDTDGSRAYNSCALPNDRDIVPGGAASVIYSFDEPAGHATSWLLYMDNDGPWLNFTLPPANGTASSYSPVLVVDSDVWKFVDPFGNHGSRDNYSLWVNLRLTNAGSQPLSVQGAAFDLYWNGTSLPALPLYTWSSFDLPPGGSADLSVAFRSEGLHVPDRIEYGINPSKPPGSAPVPMPTGPSAEVVLSNLTVAWNMTNPYGAAAASGNRYLWLGLDFANSWNASLSTDPCLFTALGDDGSQDCFSWRLGGPDVAANSTARLTLVIEVPLAWNLAALRFDSYQGPWADATP